MENNKQAERMEAIYHVLGDIKLTKANRAKISGMIRSAFINGFQTALAAHAGITGENEQTEAAVQNDTCQHILFLDRENSK